MKINWANVNYLGRRIVNSQPVDLNVRTSFGIHFFPFLAFIIIIVVAAVVVVVAVVDNSEQWMNFWNLIYWRHDKNEQIDRSEEWNERAANDEEKLNAKKMRGWINQMPKKIRRCWENWLVKGISAHNRERERYRESKKKNCSVRKWAISFCSGVHWAIGRFPSLPISKWLIFDYDNNS